MLQFLELAAQRLHFVLERIDLAQQVDVALVGDGALFQRGDALGQARPLGMGRCRQHQQRCDAQD